jgi:hypothetical protein
MFKLKQFGVAVAILLTTASVFANNIRAADQVYLAVAGKTAGQSGTFISDVWISNLSDTDSVDISIIFTPTGGTAAQQNFNKALTLLPKERREVIDFFPTVLKVQSGFGDLVFNACKAGADCTPDSNGQNTNYRNITVESRIYSIPPGTTLSQNPPTTGQLFSGIPWYLFGSTVNSGFDTLMVAGLRNTGGNTQAGTYRGNIGLVNASQFSSTTLTVTLFNSLGQQQGTPATFNLSPLGHTQVNISNISQFASFQGATATGGYILVTQGNVQKVIAPGDPTKDADLNGCSNGCPAFMAYGSILDNVSGDATTQEAQFLTALTDTQIACIFAPAASNCKNGKQIRRAVRH